MSDDIDRWVREDQAEELLASRDGEIPEEPVDETELAFRCLAAMRYLARYAAGTVPPEHPDMEPLYPGGADMVDAVNDTIEALGLTAPPQEEER